MVDHSSQHALHRAGRLPADVGRLEVAVSSLIPLQDVAGDCTCLHGLGAVPGQRDGGLGAAHLARGLQLAGASTRRGQDAGWAPVGCPDGVQGLQALRSNLSGCACFPPQLNILRTLAGVWNWMPPWHTHSAATICRQTAHKDTPCLAICLTAALAGLCPQPASVLTQDLRHRCHNRRRLQPLSSLNCAGSGRLCKGGFKADRQYSQAEAWNRNCPVAKVRHRSMTLEHSAQPSPSRAEHSSRQDAAC